MEITKPTLVFELDSTITKDMGTIYLISLSCRTTRGKESIHNIPPIIQIQAKSHGSYVLHVCLRGIITITSGDARGQGLVAFCFRVHQVGCIGTALGRHSRVACHDKEAWA